MSDEQRACLLGMVLQLRSRYGMTAADIAAIFTRKNIKAGLEILKS